MTYDSPSISEKAQSVKVLNGPYKPPQSPVVFLGGLSHLYMRVFRCGCVIDVIKELLSVKVKVGILYHESSMVVNN